MTSSVTAGDMWQSGEGKQKPSGGRREEGELMDKRGGRERGQMEGGVMCEEEEAGNEGKEDRRNAQIR